MDTLIREVTITGSVAELLRQMTSDEWNEYAREQREAVGDEWGADVRGMSFGSADLRYKDLRNANLCGCDMDYAKLDFANLTDAKVNTFTSLYRTSFEQANITGVKDFNDCQSVNSAKYVSTAIGYVAPLLDVTEAVARVMLRDAINNELPEVCEGLREMGADGLKFHWSGETLKFYMVHEIQRFRDRCKEENCECDTDHACVGGCSCCACYNGDCGCERDHDNEVEETDEWYLATIIGHIEYRWNDHRGLFANIVMDASSRHPHVGHGGQICWGDATIEPGLKAADHLMTIMGWIGQHNPSDPYREMHELPLIRRGY